MKRIGLYCGLAIKDVFRLWSATQLQIVIISGICLPILILLGLKNGHVADLREELATSPTGRQVIFWSAQGGDLLSEPVMENVQASITNAELIIPESQRLVFGIPAGSSDEKHNGGELGEINDAPKTAITLYSTLPGDPLLAQFGIELISAENREIILARSIAEVLGVNVGETFEIEISRKLNAERESHRLQFVLKDTLPTGEEGEGSGTGYAHLDVMQLLERYGTGASVDAWGIPAMKGRAATDLYESMLLYCFRGPRGDLSENDHEFLRSRGLSATKVIDANVRSLFGALNESARDELVVYRVERIDRNEGSISPIRDNPQLVVRNTEAEDDMIVRWCDPVALQIDGKDHLLVGLTLPTKRETGGWINTFLRHDARRFTYEESINDPFSVFILNGNLESQNGSFSLALTEKISVSLRDCLQKLEEEPSISGSEEKADTVTTAAIDEDIIEQTANDGEAADETSITEEERPESAVTVDATVDASPIAQVKVQANEEEMSADATTFPVAVVPVNLLAYIHQLKAGRIQFDSSGRRFVEIPSDLEYTKARLYVRTIDDVPNAVTWLASKNYAVLSESSRIAEIHEQDRSLQTLVVVVAFGVFVFGVVTVFSVLVDSTDRKKGTIGILRVMGMSRFGVFTMVLCRAFVIGLLAAVLCVFVGYGLASLLRAEMPESSLLAWKPVISVVLNPTDISFVALGALLCASFGAVFPALRASALDPFDAITEGQFG